LNIEHDPRLTSAELGYLWSAYQGDTMSVCVFTHFLQHIEDSNIKVLLEHAMDLSQQHIEIIRNIFDKEGVKVPQGFIEDDDVNLTANRLFSDIFYLYYVKNMAKGGLATHSISLPNNFRKDILSFNSKCLTSAIELHNEAAEIMLQKGIATRPPYIPYPKEIEFVHKQSFILEMLGSRSLEATEVTNLYSNLLTNNFGSCIAAGFAQTTNSKEVRDYFLRGRGIALKQKKVFEDYLESHSLPTPTILAINQDVMPIAESPFSEKLMMYHFGLMCHTGVGNYGIAISASMRSDLITDYSRLIMEVLKYSEDGLNIMIKNGWFERPPMISYKE